MLDQSKAIELIKNYIKSWNDNETNYDEILKIDQIRLAYSRERLVNSEIRSQKETDNSIENTVKHNLWGVDPENSLNRPMALLGPLIGTNEASNRERKKILIVGPRSENELFLYAANGFRRENITCVDLISYSDNVDIGDMHNLRYKDSSFDIVVCGWVLAYSKNQSLAISEMVRVTKSGGLIAIGSDINKKSNAEKEEYAKAVLNTRGYELRSEGLPNSEELISKFNKYSEKVIFDNHVNGNGRWNNVIIKLK